MSENIVSTPALSDEERQQIEAMADRHGYSETADFLSALERAYRANEQPEYDFDTKEGILAGLSESWHQAMTGDTRPISELWDALNSDE